mgnify:CR=1 FL=1
MHALTCNLANFKRTLALPEAVSQWPLTSLRAKLSCRAHRSRHVPHQGIAFFGNHCRLDPLTVPDAISGGAVGL